MRLRIGFDAKRLFNNFSGLGQYSRTLVKSLQSHFPEHQYFLYTPNITRNADTEYFLDASKFHVVVFSQRRLYHSMGASFLGKYWRLKGILGQLKKDKIQIFHGLNQELPVGIRAEGIKTVVTVHDLIPAFFPVDYSWIDRQIFWWKTRHAVVTGDQLLTISEKTRKNCINFFPDCHNKVKVLYPAIDPEEFKNITNLHLRDKTIPKNYFLFVGANHHRKNLLEAIVAMACDLGNLEFSLVVTGNVRPKLKHQYVRVLRQYKFQEKVIFLGSISRARLLKLYKNATALLYLSEFEGFGLPPVEASMLGIPTICHSDTPFMEITKPSSTFRFKANTTGELANQINHLLKFPDRFKIHLDIDKILPKSVVYKLSNIYHDLSI